MPTALTRPLITDGQEVYPQTTAEIVKGLIDYIYPVGSIYTSTVDIDPNTKFGGTWERIKDRFLLAAGDSYAAGSTGGEATHRLIQSEIPDYCIGFYPSAVMENHGQWTDRGIRASNRERGDRNTVTGNTGTTNPNGDMKSIQTAVTLRTTTCRRIWQFMRGLDFSEKVMNINRRWNYGRYKYKCAGITGQRHR